MPKQSEVELSLLGFLRAELLDGVAQSISRAPTSAEPGATPLGLSLGVDADPAHDEEPLTALSDDEYLAIFDDLVARYLSLKTLYESGMAQAAGPEQETQMAELRQLLGDPGSRAGQPQEGHVD